MRKIRGTQDLQGFFNINKGKNKKKKRGFFY